MKAISDIYTSMEKEANAEIESLSKSRAKYRFFVRKEAISLPQFIKLITLRSNAILLAKGKHPCFEVDDRLLPIATNLYYWLVGDKEFTGDLYKGILIGGKVGVGKTIFLQAFVEIFCKLSNREANIIASQEVRDRIKQHEPEWWRKRIIMIDDIGREPMEVQEWGNKTLPIPYIIDIRDVWGGLTFGTTNFALVPPSDKKTLTDFYGEYIVDRMISMFNLIVYPGDTRRK